MNKNPNPDSTPFMGAFPHSYICCLGETPNK
jgi:hypothetical protein